MKIIVITEFLEGKQVRKGFALLIRGKRKNKNKILF